MQKTNIFAIVTHHRDVVALHPTAKRQLYSSRTVSTALPARVCASTSSEGTTNHRRRARHQQFLARRQTIRSTMSVSFGRSTIRRTGSPIPRPARQGRARQRVEPPVRRDQQNLVRRFRMEGEARPVAILELLFRAQVHMPFSARIQPMRLQITVIARARSSLPAAPHRLARLGQKRAPRAPRTVLAEKLADALKILLICFHCRRGLASRSSKPARSSISASRSATSSIFFQPPQAAQPHVQDRLGLHLGSAHLTRPRAA